MTDGEAERLLKACRHPHLKLFAQIPDQRHGTRRHAPIKLANYMAYVGNMMKDAEAGSEIERIILKR